MNPFTESEVESATPAWLEAIGRRIAVNQPSAG
jgi:hypothetical protein